MASSSGSFLPLTESGVLITGGTSGVGLASAIALAAAGVPRIGIIGRSVDRGEKARADILRATPNVRVEFIAADANIAEQAVYAGARAKELLGNIDVLLNATVGPYVPELFHETKVEDIIPMIVQQQVAPMHMCSVVLPGMRERKHGAIINIASDAAKVATVGEAILGGAMAAIVMFSKALAMEAKRFGVRVNVLTPSLVEGTMMYEKVRSHGFSAKLFDKAAKLAHLGLAQPDDLAQLVVFLAGPHGARLTGQAISLNGGISAG